MVFISGICSLVAKSQRIVVNENIELIKISSNVFLHVSYSEDPNFGRFASNGMIFVDKNQCFLFDTPVDDSLTKQLVDYIQDSLKIEIIGFVPNHWHNDCMGGINYLKTLGVKTYANELTIQKARTNNLPLPETGFKDSLFLTLHDKIIQCYYFGPAHSSDNIVVWLPAERILFGGCMVKELKSKSLGNLSDADVDNWPITLRKVINRFKNAKIVIPGHGKFGGNNLLMHTLKLAEEYGK
jgi:metallo-beta-lactamase class B